MSWDVETTAHFRIWWSELSDEERESIDAVVHLLEELGPHLRFPHSSGIASSRHTHMRELRIQHHGKPWRVLYAFDPRRVAVLLVGGSKAGQDRWYRQHVPIADRLFDQHLEELKSQGGRHG